MKQARTIKQGEIPYKLVKGRPKRVSPQIKIELNPGLFFSLKS